MKLSELMTVLAEIRLRTVPPQDPEVRIGDQVESGPYLHAPVGGVFEGAKGSVILCANDDAEWHDEVGGAYIDLAEMPELPVLWKAP